MKEKKNISNVADLLLKNSENKMKEYVINFNKSNIKN